MLDNEYLHDKLTDRKLFSAFNVRNITDLLEFLNVNQDNEKVVKLIQTANETSSLLLLIPPFKQRFIVNNLLSTLRQLLSFYFLLDN